MARLFLISALFLCSGIVPAQEETEEPLPLYQVEIIVFQHIYSDELAEEVSQVNDYRSVTRPLPLPGEIETDLDADGVATETLAEDPSINSLDIETDIAHFFGLLNAVADPAAEDELIYVIDEKSQVMAGIWSRLSRSPAHDPLHYAGWQQNAYPPEQQNPLRIHDELALVEPVADSDEPDELFAVEPENEPTAPIIEISTEVPDVTSDVENGYMGSFDSLIIEEEVIDEADFTSYRLDGQVSLVQRKFLHINMDIEWRELQAIPFLEADEFEDVPVYSLYTVLQRRQVHEDRLEYFDTPWLGVIALVTEIEIPEEPEAIELPIEEVVPQETDTVAARDNR